MNTIIAANPGFSVVHLWFGEDGEEATVTSEAVVAWLIAPTGPKASGDAVYPTPITATWGSTDLGYDYDSMCRSALREPDGQVHEGHWGDHGFADVDAWAAKARKEHAELPQRLKTREAMREVPQK